MIVGLTTVQDKGAGFRTRLFMPPWKAAKDALQGIEFSRVPAIEARIIIGRVTPSRSIVGIEGPSFVVETRIPIDEFKLLSIREKNDLVLDTIFESIKAAYAHFGDTPPPSLDAIWREVRAAP